MSRSQLTAAVMHYARYPEVIRREVEVTQFYGLMDQTNVSLLQILDCDVDLAVRAKRLRRSPPRLGEPAGLR